MSVLSNFETIITDRFIETGTFEGMSLWNASLRFKECLSVEIDKDLYVKAYMQFSCIPNVKVYHGNSPEFLRQVIDPKIDTTFWLDAHYHGTELPAGIPQCPLMEELAEIVKLNWTIPPIILIDDASIYLSKDQFPSLKPGVWKEEEWPRVEEIDEMLKGYTRSQRGEALLYRQYGHL